MTPSDRAQHGSPQALPIAAGAAVLLLGALVMAGWLLHVPALVQIDPAFAPMQFNSALSFVALGAATVCAASERRRAAAVLAIAASVLPLLTLVQYATGTTFGIDTLFVEPFIAVHTSHPGRMAPTTALCFAGCAGALLLHRPVACSPPRALAGAVLAALTLGAAGSVLAAYLFGLDAVHGNYGTTRMALHTAIAFVLLAAAIASMPLLRSGEPRDRTIWLNGSVGAVLAVVVLTSWHVLRADQQREQRRLLVARGDYIAQSLADGIRSQRQTLRGMEANRERREEMSEADWRDDVRAYLRDDPVLHGIAWVGPDGGLRWLETGPAVDGAARAAIEAAVRAGAGDFGVVQSAPARTLLLLRMPRDDDGTMIGVVGLTPMLQQLFGALAARGVAVTVRDGGRVLADDGVQSAAQPVHRRTVQIGAGVEWRIEVAPAAQAAPTVGAAMSELLLFVSLLLCAALLIAFHYARRASLRGAALEIERRRLADVIAATNVGTWEWNLETGALFVNERWTQMIGLPPQPFDGARWRTLAHPDDVERIERAAADHVAGRTPAFEGDYRLRHSDGRWIWVQARGRVVRRSADGRPLVMSGTNTDISERRAIEESLRLSQRRFSLAFETAAQGMALLALDGRWLEVNASLCRLLGYTREQLLRTTLRAIEDPDDDAGSTQLLDDVLAGVRGDYQVERRCRHRDGHPIWVLLSVSLVRDDASAPLYFIAQLLDISGRKRIDDMKAQFVSTVSHELRTPLTSIAGALGLVLGGAVGELPAPMRSMLAVARQNSERLNQLINDLLDLEKLEAGQLPIQLTRASLRAETEMAVAVNQGYAERLGVSFVVAAADDGDVEIDRLRLQQVLANLLSNAAKFSNADGTVTVAVRRHGEWMRVSVHNDGEGIAPEFRSRIFRKFSQADSADTRQRGGTGLGLAISKELVERMGGTIGFESEPGRGATFFVEFRRVEARSPNP